MDFIEKESIPGLMIFIDFEKAFDSIEWEFLLYCLCCVLANIPGTVQKADQDGDS